MPDQIDKSLDRSKNFHGKVPWDAVRLAYIERVPIPSYLDLSKEFGCTGAAISNQAREEDWPTMRKQRQEKTLAECAANDIILSAIKSEGPILQQARSVTAQFLSAIEICIQKVMAGVEGMKPSLMANTLNTLGFALANGGKFMDTVGLIGMQKELSKTRREGSEGSVPWDKGMMQQINVTVTGLEAKAKAESIQTEAQATESKQPATAPNSDPVPDIDA